MAGRSACAVTYACVEAGWTKDPIEMGGGGGMGAWCSAKRRACEKAPNPPR
jgi:hypothetical protein